MSVRRSRALRAPQAAFLALALALLGLLYRGLPRALTHPRASTLILDRHGAYHGELSGEGDARGYWPPPYSTPDRIARATLEAEDRHFYEHPGVYLPSVARALWQDLCHLRIVSGASTVAMQVVRLQAPRSMGGLRPPGLLRGLFEKLREAAGALSLIHAFGHEAVLRQYLTIAPYGQRVHGAERAARLYFDKPLEDLSWIQAAFLAALPQRPGRMNPYDPRGVRRGLRRAHRILRGLAAKGQLDPHDLALALHSDLGLVPLPKRPPEALHATLAWGELLRRHPGSAPIETATLDLGMQATAARILRRRLDDLALEGATEGAALVVDPATSEILAYVGSRDYFSAEGRGAIDFVQTKRSPGSTLKPFIYALGLAQGRFTAASELPDTPLDLQTHEREAYLPENVNHGFLGPMLLREALGNSRNLPALRLLADVGVEPALELFDRGGVADVSFAPGRYGLGLAIGNLPVTLQELVGLYGALARGGEGAPLRHFLTEPKLQGPRLFRRDVAALVTRILADPSARRPSFHEGGPLDYPYAVAVKTGTSQGFRDAWAVAYSDRLLIGVWMGDPDWHPMAQVTGARGPAVAVHELMDELMRAREPYREVARSFPEPEGYRPRLICPLSGKLVGPDCPDAKVELFAPGSEPTLPCSYHSKVRLDRRNGLLAGPGCPRAFVATRPLLTLPRRYERWAQDHHQELAQAAQLLARGGRLVILSPAHQWLFSPFDDAIASSSAWEATGVRDPS